MRKGAGGFAALCLLASLGCLVWPFPTGQLLDGRGRIRPGDTAFPEAGRATRAEVLLRFGEPDEVGEGGRVLIYRWTEMRGLFAAATYGQAIVIPFRGPRWARFRFDGEGRLTAVAFAKGDPAVWVPAQGPARR